MALSILIALPDSTGMLVNAYYIYSLSSHSLIRTTSYIYCELVPAFWVHDVDGTFVIWTHGQEELCWLHHCMKNQHPNISFALEKESGCKLHFLGIILVTKKDDRFITPCLPETDPH